jgi:hypothetical protein
VGKAVNMDCLSPSLAVYFLRKLSKGHEFVVLHSKDRSCSSLHLLPPLPFQMCSVHCLLRFDPEVE